LTPGIITVESTRKFLQAYMDRFATLVERLVIPGELRVLTINSQAFRPSSKGRLPGATIDSYLSVLATIDI